MPFAQAWQGLQWGGELAQFFLAKIPALAMLAA
jgi:hypothetical protein